MSSFSKDKDDTTRTALVITVSDRSHRGERDDLSGPLAASLLAELDIVVKGVVVVPDAADAIQAALRSAIRASYDLVITTGGTGLSPRDVTPEATRAVLERDAPGIADAVRASGGEAVPTSMLSRGVAGTIARTLVINLPGSVGGVRDGMRVLAPVLPHALAQIHGADH